jgi:hypothetical protein
MQTDMPEAMTDDAVCAKLRGGGAQWPVPQLAASRIEALAARLATVEAERDAAMARIDVLTIKAAEAYRDGHIVGERRAVARIVADLREEAANAKYRGTAILEARRWWKPFPAKDYRRWLAVYAVSRELADRYERGDHLQEGE